MSLVAIVGMAGAGKSEVASVLKKMGFTIIRFGDITDEEIARRGFKLNEANERRVRELLREKHGMEAYAKLNLPRIDAALKQGSVVIDGLYSWEEYVFLKDYYENNLLTLAVWASPETRYARLKNRSHRPLSAEEATSRDRVEVEKLNKGGPIAMADYTIINESSIENLGKEVAEAVARLKCQKK